MKIYCVAHREKCPIHPVSLSQRCSRVFVSDSVKYLGVTVTSDLGFFEHCEAVAAKTKQHFHIVQNFKLFGAIVQNSTQKFY